MAVLDGDMIELAVIADDLTGAADTGIKFCRTCAPVYLFSHLHLPVCRLTLKPGAISVFTNTRNLSTKEIRKVLAGTARELQYWQSRQIYKKIDSCMRGQVGLECEILLASLDLKVCFIAPALPDQGRTTVHGVHLLNGTPVAETEIGRDPVCPVRESRLAVLIAAQSRSSVGQIDVDLLEQGVEAVSSNVAKKIGSGVRHIVFDAVVQAHLDLITELALNRFPSTLLAGSAGLAESLAAQLSNHGNQSLVEENQLKPPESVQLLMICGSASDTIQLQVNELIRNRPCRREVLEAETLANPHKQALRRSLALTAAHTLSRHCLVLQIEPPDRSGGSTRGDLLIKGLAEVVFNIIEETKPGALFLSGGDTATAVLDRLNSHLIRLEAELMNGLVKGTIMDGALLGRSVVTKAGSFGGPETLIKLYDYWYNRSVEAV